MTDTFFAQILATSLAEWLAVVLAIAYVWLAARQNSWCWLCAFLSTAIYTYLFWQVTLPFQSLLNFFYMIMAVYGYLQWKKGGQEQAGVQSLPWYWHLAIVPTLLLAGWGLATIAAGQFNNEFLWLDACIQVLSVVTTFMVAHKVLQNWVYWFFINLASAYLYAQSGLILSACLFAGYVGFSVYGYWQWLGQWKLQHGTHVYN
ncbi:nicotinamide riboside transporter PnuC [Salinimonas chungwhensis]|uniref:nicotinamide riboside transporter PnuC n=1 Tax=Salinimonas chungwhensis TaxID=265425 RepID=UPI00037FF885|nr:nicotinamide riboside transporter PnuC [Salinimonas chungwhensis]